ncbi:MAG: hypothetical protein GY819_13340 [Planctomycetaceae bacterium]|nr:hypothetical protein [Planctomycetaceae bacterium]
MWGMRQGVGQHYIDFHVGNSQNSLKAIVTRWLPQYSNLYLAFVGNSLPNVPLEDRDLADLSGKGYQNYLDDAFMKFSSFDFNNSQSNLKLGLHGVSHKLYTDMSAQEKLAEGAAIEAILKENQRFAEFFVYPKNLADSETINRYKSRFVRIRVNSRSRLYRTSEFGVNRTRRIMRFLDSFLPIYELFCDKRPEHGIDNAVVGTHFFRANLPPVLLIPHYIRLRFGIWIMNLLGEDVHIWSHPHNFGGRNFAINLFVRLSRQP